MIAEPKDAPRPPAWERASNASFGKAGSFPVGDDSRGQLLPIRDRPSVITTVADHPMKGRISKLRREASAENVRQSEKAVLKSKGLSALENPYEFEPLTGCKNALKKMISERR